MNIKKDINKLINKAFKGRSLVVEQNPVQFEELKELFFNYVWDKVTKTRFVSDLRTDNDIPTVEKILCKDE